MIDAAFRGVYRVGYRVMRVWWRIRRPSLRGAYVVARLSRREAQEPEILLVRNSYRPGWTVPCGALHRGETPRAAGRRELREEVGLDVEEERLEPAGEVSMEIDGRRDRAHFFELALRDDEPARLRPDRREVVRAELVGLSQLETLDLMPQLRRYLERAVPVD